MEQKPYYSHSINPRTAVAYPSSEFVELAGKIVKLQSIEHNGELVADAATRIKQEAQGDSVEEMELVRMWLRGEFNLPATVRAHCLTCFIRVFTNEEFVETLVAGVEKLVFREQTYKLHWQSDIMVCTMAPLIAVSFRITPAGEYFAVAQVWAARSSKTLPTKNTTNTMSAVIYDPAKLPVNPADLGTTQEKEA